MTVQSSTNKTIFAGNGAQTAFTFSFNAGYVQGAPSPALALSYLSVTYTDPSGNQTTVAQGSGTNQCQITLNAPVSGALWGLGGTVTYNPAGTPIPAGSTLTLLRTVPLTQIVSLSNQGALFPQTVEMAMDLLDFQIQQLAEQYGRAFVAAVSDPSPLPLPPVAQRANLGAAFDSNGNMIAGSLPSSGVISSAMQPVVDAATLATGRQAFGLGGMAVEGIGAGLQDDGSGNARVLLPLVEVSTNQSIGKTAHTTAFAASGSLTFAVARANTLFSGFSFAVYALTAPVTLTIDPADNFFGQASGASFTIPRGAVAQISTDGRTAGIWYAQVSGITSPSLPGTFNVLLFGLTPDGVSVTDAATTAASTTLTSASAGFNASTDVGKTISVEGAGAAGATLVTTIASVTNATTVVMSASASTTTTGKAMTFGTDNTSVLNAMITSIGSGGGQIWFPKGIYVFNGTVSIVSLHGMQFVGQSQISTNAAILKFVGTGSGNFIDVQNASFTQFINLEVANTSLSGFSGNLIAVRNAGVADPAATRFQNVNFNMAAGATATAHGLALDKSIETHIDNCSFVGGSDGITGQSGAGSSYSNVVSVRGGQFFQQAGVAVRHLGESWSFYGVTFEPRIDGTARAMLGTSLTPVNGVSIIGCWFGDASVGGTPWIDLYGHGLTFNGNLVSGVSSTDGISGVQIENFKGFAITGNTFQAIQNCIQYASATCDGGILSGNSYTSAGVLEAGTGNKGANVVNTGNVAF
jgi:hypothetical protein